MSKSIVSAFLLLMGSIVYAEPPEFIQDCMDCHGENGISTEPDIPTIAGASVVFIEEAFHCYERCLRPAIKSKYRRGDTSRPEKTMKEIVQALTKEQITQVAEYFSALPFVAAKQDFDASQVEIGRKTHNRKCQKCHEDGGSSAADDAGILAGQWTPYLKEAMKNILNGTRDTDKKMKKKVKKLSDKEWQALLHYYASQQD